MPTRRDKAIPPYTVVGYTKVGFDLFEVEVELELSDGTHTYVHQVRAAPDNPWAYRREQLDAQVGQRVREDFG